MHTQGKLRIGEYRDIVTESGEKLEIIGVSMPCGHVPKDDPCHANARRLVACWNACEGIETEKLEGLRIASSPMLLELMAAVKSSHEVTA